MLENVPSGSQGVAWTMEVSTTHPNITVEQSTLDRHNTEALRLTNEVQSFLQSMTHQLWSKDGTVRSNLSTESIRAASQLARNLVSNLKTIECFFVDR